MSTAVSDDSVALWQPRSPPLASDFVCLLVHKPVFCRWFVMSGVLCGKRHRGRLVAWQGCLAELWLINSLASVGLRKVKVKDRVLATALLNESDGQPEALYSLWSGSWLAGASGTASHHGGHPFRSQMNKWSKWTWVQPADIPSPSQPQWAFKLLLIWGWVCLSTVATVACTWLL